MLFFTAKLFQATGLGILAYGFITHYPERLDYKIILISGCVFTAGWLIQTYMLKK